MEDGLMSPKAVATVMTSTFLMLIAYSLIVSPYSRQLQLRHFPLAGHSSPQQQQQHSCASRQQLQIIRTSSSSSSSSSNPSPFLLSRLKDYEQRHKRCDPYSQPFHRNSHDLVRVKNYSSNLATKDHQVPLDDDHDGGCKYVVWTPVNGMGNRMLSIASSFLYALLTNRVLLVDFGPDMVDLFCEPFHNTTWLLPGDLTLRGIANTPEFREAYSLGNFFKRQLANVALPPLLQLFLSYENDDYDKLFYKDETQRLVSDVPWLVLRSGQYFVPYLFLMPGFRTELDRMFPDDKETVFHHLGRYLFSPSNQVWERVVGFYDTYLAQPDQRIGLQIRVFHLDKTPASLILGQVVKCIQEESRIIVPFTTNITTTITTSSSGQSRTTSAILIASLLGEFYTELSKMYGEQRERAMSSVVGVYQTSQEEVQVLDDGSHNMKALVDMYLLSMCDVLVTSPRSTFGYVAHSLAGLTPWILQSQDIEDEEERVKEPACRRGVSKEPCLQFHPDYYDTNPDHREPGWPVPVIMDCEDFRYGLKLVNRRL